MAGIYRQRHPGLLFVDLSGGVYLKLGDLEVSVDFFFFLVVDPVVLDVIT